MNFGSGLGSITGSNIGGRNTNNNNNNNSGSTSNYEDYWDENIDFSIRSHDSFGLK